MSPLFTSVRLGPYTLDHRIALAPLTRMRAAPARSQPGSVALADCGRALDTTLRAMFERWYPGLANDNQANTWRAAVA